jgi:chemotaxis protein methyltransferase CheR
MSVASLQQQLKVTGLGEEIHVGEYLKKLCETLAGSMIRERRPVSLAVSAGPAFVGSEQAVSIGLIVTELVINALKHAFPIDTATGHIEVSYTVNGPKWSLSVTDNGVGMAKDAKEKKSGLGSTLIDALAQKLEATVNTQSSAGGTKVLVEGSLEPAQRVS